MTTNYRAQGEIHKQKFAQYTLVKYKYTNIYVFNALIIDGNYQNI